MNNIISVSGGNDSMAMLLVIARLCKQEPNLFHGDSWHVCYFNTGWARDGWDKRIDIVKRLCTEMDFNYHELKASALNQHIKTENDELFESLPEEAHFGMVAHIKKKAIFPNIKMKWCTAELKIKPMMRWLKQNRFTPKNTTQWIGIRAEEGGSGMLSRDDGISYALTKTYANRMIQLIGGDEASRVYCPTGISKTIKNGGGGGVKTGLYAVPVLTPDRPTKRQNGRRFKTNGEPSFTLTAQDRHGVFDGRRIRKLMPIECERLQGFPDDSTKYGADGELMSDSQRYKCCGNAVTVNVVAWIFSI